MSSCLRDLIDNGFGEARTAEDPLDAMLGRLSMIDVVLGHRTHGAPDDASVRSVEGWILGQGGN